jgi:hypothetical protein
LIRWNPGEDQKSILPPFVGRNKEKMGRHSIITTDDVLRIIRLLRWATRFILVLFFGGGVKRIKALERLLPALERDGSLYAEWHRGEKVYSIPRERRVKPVSMDHELACALILVLLWRCRMEEGEIVPERAFRGFGVVPEGAIRYSKERNTMIVIEYETNKDHKRATKGKITRYLKYLPLMEAKFQRRITVLFVLDITRAEVIDFVKRMAKTFWEADFSDYDGSGEREAGSDAVGVPTASDGGDRFPLDPFFWTDFQTLRSVSGNLLKARIYFWSDGNEWSLSDND